MSLKIVPLETTTRIYPTEFESTQKPKGCCECCSRVFACFSKLFSQNTNPEMHWHASYSAPTTPSHLSSSTASYTASTVMTKASTVVQRSESTENYSKKLSISFHESMMQTVDAPPGATGQERMEGKPNSSR